ncbi:MAG: lamin tail domain-containing protein, partial [Syntrophothermus sp.]
MFQRGLRQILVLCAVVLQASFCQNRSGQLAFSEVMFYPSAANSEFIELFNTSSTDTFDLAGSSIIYHTSSPDTIISSGGGMLLAPLGYAVIFEGDYDLAAGIYSKMVPAGALLLKIKSNSFGSSGMSNTTGRTLCLIGKAKDTLDIFTYTADNKSGFSDEKIISDSLISGYLWANSISFNGTPGSTNSVLKNAWHLTFPAVILTPVHPEESDEVSFSASVVNDGFLEIPSAELHCFLDKNLDSTGSPDEQFFTFSFRNILPGDSIPFSKTIGPLYAGVHRLILTAEYRGSYGNSLGSSYAFTFQIAMTHAGKYDIIINEIMYAPPPGEPEWIELYNRSAHEIDLRKWKISDNSSKAAVSASSLLLRPGEYAVLSSDTVINKIYSIPAKVIHVGLPALNNTGDMVILSDSTGRTIDSVFYSPLWGGSKSTSLERVMADSPSVKGANWKSAELGLKGTPGLINSVTPREFDLAADVLKFPGFTFIPENAKAEICIKNKGLKKSQNISLQIRRSINPGQQPASGELVWESAFPELSPGDSIIASVSLQVPEEGSNKFAAIVTAERDDKTENNIMTFQITGIRLNEQRGDLIINEFMYAPEAGSSEWIELFNNSSKNILFSKYRISNHADTAIVKCNPVLIHPLEYFIISSDSSLFNKYPVSCPYVITEFPSLNNQGDNIIILDSLSRVIDSLKYTPLWGGAAGCSLEKILPSGPSAEISNWKTSVSINKATPGSKNSVSPRDFDPAINYIIITPPFPSVSDTLNFSAAIINKGLKRCSFTVELSAQDLYDTTMSEVLSTSPVFSLEPGDSLIWRSPLMLYPPIAAKCYIFRIISESDEDKKNNSARSKIIPGYECNALVINEIMYAPPAGQSEWIELYNYQNYRVNLLGWDINDGTGPPIPHGIGRSINIDPGQMIIIASDSSFFSFHKGTRCPVLITDMSSLNNDKDAIVIKDVYGNVIDSVYYYGTWGGSNGYSLERIFYSRPSYDKDNWGQC